jgi:hypothetical protein
VLGDLKCVLKEDSGLEINISKTVVLSKTITQQHSLMWHTSSSITHHNLFTLVGRFPFTLSTLTALWELENNIGVSIGTDNFVRQFVPKKCRDIIEDVEKLDAIEDSFIHFQVLRFCQTTTLQHINSHG